jgi:hypothetical protein
MKTIRTMIIAVTCYVASLNGPVWAEAADAPAEPFAGHESAACEVAYSLAGEYLSEDAISRLNLVDVIEKDDWHFFDTDAGGEAKDSSES